MKVNPFQPVIFNDSQINCKCDSNTTQLVQAGDVTQFQIELEVCNDMPNLISDGDFDAVDSSIYWEANQFSFLSDSAVSNSGQNGSLLQRAFGSEQRIVVEVSIAELIGDPLVVWFGDTKIREIDRPGTYKLYGVTSELPILGVENNFIKFVSSENNSVTIENVAAYPLEDNFALMLLDINNNILSTRTLANDVADANYTFFRVWENVVTVSFDWDYVTDAVNGLGLDYGCYKFALVGICENPCGQLGTQDPNFNIPIGRTGADTYPWSSVLELNITDSVIDNQVYSYEGTAGGASELYLYDPISDACGGNIYDVTIVVDSVNYAQLQLLFGSTFGPIIASAGTHAFSITPATAGPLAIYIKDIGPLFKGDMVISSISVEMRKGQWSFDIISNPFNFKLEHLCTLLLTAANNDDAYGLRFGGALYNPQLRAKGTLRANNPNAERSDFIDSNLKKQITYFRQRQVKELRLSNIADYQVEWLTLWAGFNIVFVEDVDYIVEEANDIDIRRNRFCDTAAVTINIGKQLQDLESSNQNGLSAATNINNYLVEVKDLNSKIVFLDGDEIEING